MTEPDQTGGPNVPYVPGPQRQFGHPSTWPNQPGPPAGTGPVPPYRVTPPGGFQPPPVQPLPPSRPPRARRNKILLAGGGAAALLVLCLCGIVVAVTPQGHSTGSGSAYASPAQNQAPMSDSKQATKAAAPADTPRGPKKFALGEPGDESGTDGTTGTVVVSDAKVRGQDIVVTIDITCTAGSMSYNPFFWAYLDASGVSHEQDIFADLQAPMHSGDLAAGQKVHAQIAFKGGADALHGGQVQYSPGFRTISYWVIP